jgi:ubiquinone/menaquinone biosynthesis C-methylase UbiE
MAPQPGHVFDPAVLLAEIERFRLALVDHAARRCADAGWTSIALYGAGRHTRRYIRQPWRWRGVRVEAVIDDHAGLGSIDGVPVVCPAGMPAGIDAVVISSDAHEASLYARAAETLAGRAPIIRIYGDPPPIHEPDPAPAIARLASAGLSDPDAQWLAANRAERHDASVDSLTIQRTELHLRRYHLASRYARGARALDCACGTGYGAAILARAGAATVHAIDRDPDTIAYARRHHATPTVEFQIGDALATRLPGASVDLVTSFETIEHLPSPGAFADEIARVLRPGGVLILSTPNDRGLTRHHEHSLTQGDLDGILSRNFVVTQRLGQIPGNDPIDEDLPPAIYRPGLFPLPPETLIAIATRR